MLLLCDGDKWKSHFCVSQELVKNLENGVMENEVVNVFFFAAFFFLLRRSIVVVAIEILFSLELNLRAIKMTNHFPIENFEHFYELRMKL